MGLKLRLRHRLPLPGVLLAMIPLLAACASSVHPPLPQQGILTAPVREASHIALPVQLDLQSLALDLEKALDDGAWGESHKESGVQWKLGVERTGPIRLVVRDDMLHGDMPLHLQAKASASKALGLFKAPPVEMTLPVSFSIALPKPGEKALTLQIPKLDLGLQLAKPLASLNQQLREGIDAGPLALHGRVENFHFAGLYLDGKSLEPWFTVNAQFQLDHRNP